MDDKWTLETTFTGAIIKQIGLDLIQRGKSSATGTAGRRKQNTINTKHTHTQKKYTHQNKYIYIYTVIHRVTQDMF